MRNGCGDDCYIMFTTAGAFIRGFDHESPMTPWRTDPPQLWPGLIDDVPDTLRAFLAETAFAYDDVFAATYVLWHQNAESGWKQDKSASTKWTTGMTLRGLTSFSRS